MTKPWFTRRVQALVAAGSLLAVWMSVGAASQSRMTPGGAGAPFLQPDRCYQFIFTVAGAPNWKVLEIQEGIWIKAEIDAGSASAHREPVWINTSQIVTVRDRPCGA